MVCNVPGCREVLIASVTADRFRQKAGEGVSKKQKNPPGIISVSCGKPTPNRWGRDSDRVACSERLAAVVGCNWDLKVFFCYGLTLIRPLPVFLRWPENISIIPSAFCVWVVRWWSRNGIRMPWWSASNCTGEKTLICTITVSISPSHSDAFKEVFPGLFIEQETLHRTVKGFPRGTSGKHPACALF